MGSGGGWGAPIATSTQMGGSMYSGALQDSGATPLQQHVLNLISKCPHEQGININEVLDAMRQQGHSDAKIRYVLSVYRGGRGGGGGG